MKKIFLWIVVLYFTPACASAYSKKSRILTDQTGSFSVNAEIYQPNSSRVSLNKTVFIYPPTGGTNYIDISYAKQLAKRGAHVILLNSWSGMNEESLELSIHQSLHEKAVKAFEVGLQHVPEDNSVAVLGTSVGGIFASVVGHQFDSVETVMVIAAGAPIPFVIAYSDQSDLAEVRRKRMREFGFGSTEEYAEALAQQFELDPLSFSSLPNKNLGMVILTDDTTVPTHYQHELMRHWASPSVIEIDAGHFWGIVGAWWSYSDQVVEFLLQ